MSKTTMNTIQEINGAITIDSARVAIVVARFNGFIVESLCSGAVDTLKRSGIAESQMTIVRVPGAFEMPLVTKKLIETGDYDGVIALGAVIRGSTPHFDFVAGECAKGLANVALECSIPVVNGVLTTNTIEQAIERAGTKAGNKGAEAAMTFMEMVSLLQKI